MRCGLTEATDTGAFTHKHTIQVPSSEVGTHIRLGWCETSGDLMQSNSSPRDAGEPSPAKPGLNGPGLEPDVASALVSIVPVWP